ncbi:MAG: hypothetical protein ACJ8C4_08585 [Gemmataceae bacterium]
MGRFLSWIESACYIKEFVMKQLHAIVLFGVALLPVPGRAM